MTQHLGNVFGYDLGSEGHPSLEDSTTVDTATYRIGTVGGVHVGVWESSPGLIGAQSAEEIFVVLEGRAEVTFEDTGERIEVGRGDVVRLNAGQRNTWRTVERLRKVSVWLDSTGQRPPS